MNSDKTARVLLSFLSAALMCAGLLLLTAVSWRVTVGVLCVMWANNIVEWLRQKRPFP